MAWRDSRRHRSRLLLFSSSIVLGVAAMVAVGGFGTNLTTAVEKQSKALLGADLEVATRIPFTPEQTALLESIGDDRSTQISFSSMLRFPLQNKTRLVQVRALSGAFPYYGAIESAPSTGVTLFRQGQGVLVEENLLLQLGAKVGDPVKIGDLETEIVGALLNVPGENMLLATVAPRVFLPDDLLAASGLLGSKSIARYRYFYRFDQIEDRLVAQEKLEKIGEQNRWSVDDVDERKRELGSSLRNLYRFLSLASFVALLLGAIGVASAIQLHIREKLSSVAILRCLGCAASQTFAVYLIQAFCLALFGVIVGTAFGLGLQQSLPWVFADLVPMEIEIYFSLFPILKAAGMGLLIAMLFALFPLLPIRQVSPLSVLRVSTAPKGDRKVRLLLLGTLTITIGFFAIAQSDRWAHGLGFVAGLAGTLAILYGTSILIARLPRRVIRPTWPFVIRHGIASLYRPNNRTSLLLLALGLGTFLILTLHLTQNGLIQELFPESSEGQANAILFDVQSDQVEGIKQILSEQALPILGVSPIVNMRISTIKGQTITEIQKDPNLRLPRWALRREYRSTFRESLSDSEKLVAGTWIPQASFDDPVVPISIATDLAEDLHVTLGDEIEFDVQGIPIRTHIASLREVDWRRIQANFFLVFPKGVIDDAPGFQIITTRVTDTESSAKMQQAVSEAYPNVSSIDLMFVLEILNDVIGKISFGIRFMAFFTALTGIILLVTTTLSSRYQRIQEGIQLRTLGASRVQILKTQVVEYGVLGFMASLTASLLSVIASWTIARFVFEVGFSLPVWQIAAVIIMNCLLTVSIGIMGCWGITKHSPLAMLRQEA